jgi:alpha-amylase/alpha-mannosidase (GH57 family)
MNDGAALLLAFHNHQPVGNFRSVFETAFEDCYRPFLKAIREHPSVRFAAHYSGPLLEYMRENEPECWDILAGLAARGQVELLGGGFYEPILTTIPEADRLGQLEMMSGFLERHFGARPRGIWLTERVWEPSLPSTLARAGIEYTLLDEEHFHYAGVRDMHAYYITEDEGRPLKIFPIDKTLRYLIPFQSLDKFGSYWEGIRARGGLAILGDDGEKFGLWPGTKKWVFEEGWLDRFLQILDGDKIRTATYAEVLDERPPAGRVYLPPASYEEMMEWVLEPDAAAEFRTLKARNPTEARRFLRGGFFREFFLKYPESHHLHQRMLMVSREVGRAANEEARRELYKGECNDPLWHGVFGGLYLPHLREASYEHLLKAETLAAPELGWTAEDFDLDGRDEWVRRDRTFGLIVKPSAGGALLEIDHYPLARNLADVLSRRREAYHAAEEPQAAGGQGKSIHDLAKELPPEARHIRYDQGPRYSAVDRFFAPGVEELDSGEYADAERGDFFDGIYEAVLIGPVLRLSRQGLVRTEQGDIPVRVEKDVTADKNGRVTVDIRVLNLADTDAVFIFASEWNLYQFPEEISFGEGTVRLCSGRIGLEFEPVPVLKRRPIETLSQSEKGYDIIHQGISLLPFWTLSLSGKEEFRARILLTDHRGA